VQFELGKADTIEAFQEQKKKILEKVNDIENWMKSNPTLTAAYAYLVELIEKIKAQLEIIGEKIEPYP
jgi:hypothetical protein